MVLYSAGSTTLYPTNPPEKGIRIHFLGGAGEVGNVGCILEDRTGTRLLIDYGLAPTKPPRYPSEAPFVQDAIFTHAHIDHIGMAPWLTTHGARLHGTRLTAAVSEIMWSDTWYQTLKDTLWVGTKETSKRLWRHGWNISSTPGSR